MIFGKNHTFEKKFEKQQKKNKKNKNPNRKPKGRSIASRRFPKPTRSFQKPHKTSQVASETSCVTQVGITHSRTKVCIAPKAQPRRGKSKWAEAKLHARGGGVRRLFKCTATDVDGTEQGLGSFSYIRKRRPLQSPSVSQLGLAHLLFFFSSWIPIFEASRCFPVLSFFLLLFSFGFFLFIIPFSFSAFLFFFSYLFSFSCFNFC